MRPDTFFLFSGDCTGNQESEYLYRQLPELIFQSLEIITPDFPMYGKISVPGLASGCPAGERTA